jgi:hypothetical protein
MSEVNREELQQVLEQEGVAPEAYTFTGGHPPETYVLSVSPGGWTVYYSERGLETGRRDFDTEDAACMSMAMKKSSRVAMWMSSLVAM